MAPEGKGYEDKPHSKPTMTPTADRVKERIHPNEYALHVRTRIAQHRFSVCLVIYFLHLVFPE